MIRGQSKHSKITWDPPGTGWDPEPFAVLFALFFALKLARRNIGKMHKGHHL